MSQPVIYFKPIKGRRTYDPAIAKSVFDKEAASIATDMMAGFLPSVRTWTKQPKFRKEVRIINGISYLMIAGTDDDIYGMLNVGTKAHFVGPRNVSALRFPRTFTAKTTPGLLSSRAGYIGKRVWFSKGHMVKGIEPRKWDETLSKRWVTLLPERVNRAIRLALKMSETAKGT